MIEMNRKFDIVRRTQIALFDASGILKSEYDKLIELFSPENLAEFLGLRYIEMEEIPTTSGQYRTAGMLDRTNKTVYVSRQFPIEQRRLTGLHEIIHWMLHKHVGRDMMHRDRPIDHVPSKESVDYVEWEATHYACLYLMPEKLVKHQFAATFMLPPGDAFEFNELTAFHLRIDVEKLRKMSLFDKAVLLASVTSFDRPIVPLYQWFKVSKTAMAIRLLELNLIAPDRRRGKPNLRIV